MSVPAAPPPGYRPDWEADVVLRDGSVAHVRPIRPDDVEGIRAFHAAQSDESIYFRFFAPLRHLGDRELVRFATVDYRARVALVAEVRGRLIGIARYDRHGGSDGTTAEVAFNIADDYQGRGVGSVLLEHLAAIAGEAGVSRFVADVLPENKRMLAVFADAGFEVEHRFEDGVIAITFAIAQTEHSQAVRLAREHRAEAVSVGALLAPTSVAVIGANRRAESVGHRLLANLMDADFAGSLYAVNSAAAATEPRQVRGLPAYASIGDIGDIGAVVDLAVVAVPAAELLEVVRQCAAVGVRALLVASAGFSGADPHDQARQEDLLRTARGSGMRVVGPGSFGLANTDRRVRLNATLAPDLGRPGGLGLFAQSGALGIAVLASAAGRGLGVSTFASAGNRVDVSGNDLMQYWLDDPATSVVGLYLESMGNPRKFSRIARNLASVKPVVVVKSAVSSYRLPPGHRVRPTRVPTSAFDSMLRQSGVIRVENVHQMFDVAQLLVHQPLPAGPRVAVVSNSDALGILSADAALSWDLDVVHGPVAVPAEAGVEEFVAALEGAFAEPRVDAVMACFVPPIGSADEEVVRALSRAADRHQKTCVATLTGLHGVAETLGEEARRADRRIVPAYWMPEDAARSLAAAVRYAQWRTKDKGRVLRPDGIDDVAASALIADVLGRSPDGRALSGAECGQLLAAYGITLWPVAGVDSADAAVAAAQGIGGPVVLKSLSPVVRHTAGVNAIRTDLVTPDQVRRAYASLEYYLAPAQADRLVVQKMALPGVDCVLGSSEDPLFGPVVSFSIAGPPTDLMGDVAYRIPPMSDVDVADLVGAVRAAPLLNGHRGVRPVDHAALHDAVSRVAAMADDHPEIALLELNPVNANERGVDVLGAEIHLTPASVRSDTGRRAMTR